MAKTPIRIGPSLGELHFGRKRVQPASRVIRVFYDQAKDLLKFPLLTFIMRDHVHILIRKHRHPAEQMIANLQDASTVPVLDLKAHPLGHPVWGGPGWKVFLHSPDDIRRTIKYIDDNPIKLRMPRQEFDFVVPYDGWSFGGHPK